MSEQERPTSGGAWVRDPKTGKIKPAASKPEVAKPAAKEGAK